MPVLLPIAPITTCAYLKMENKELVIPTVIKPGTLSVLCPHDNNYTIGINCCMATPNYQQ